MNSRNIPAIKTRMDLGPDALSQMARNMGITSPIRDSLSSALGASEVNLLELTSAYSVFPDLGVKVTPVLITKITDQAGNLLEDNTVTPLNPTERAKRDTRDKVCVAPPKSLEAKSERTELPEGFPREPKSDCRVIEPDRPNMVRVISPQTAYLMLSMLREVTISGTGSSVKKMGRPDVGGKTGSTNDYSDAWFIGFNPKYTTGVWTGNDKRTTLGEKEFGAKAALPVWVEYMSYALRNEKPMNWPPPPGIEFDGDPYFRKPSYDRLLTSSPHFAPGKLLKQVSPVDRVPFPVSSGAAEDPYSMWSRAAGFGEFPIYGAIRVLSLKGQTIGIAAYTQDENGNPVLQKILPQDFGQEDFGPMQRPRGYRYRLMP